MEPAPADSPPPPQPEQQMPASAFLQAATAPIHHRGGSFRTQSSTSSGGSSGVIAGRAPTATTASTPGSLTGCSPFAQLSKAAPEPSSSNSSELPLPDYVRPKSPKSSVIMETVQEGGIEDVAELLAQSAPVLDGTGSSASLKGMHNSPGSGETNTSAHSTPAPTSLNAAELQAAALQALQGQFRTTNPPSPRTAAQRLQQAGPSPFFADPEAPPSLPRFAFQQQHCDWSSIQAEAAPTPRFSPVGGCSGCPLNPNDNDRLGLGNFQPMQRISEDGKSSTARCCSEPVPSAAAASWPPPATGSQFLQIQAQQAQQLLSFSNPRYSSTMDVQSGTAQWASGGGGASLPSPPPSAYSGRTSALSRLQLSAKMLPQVRALLGVGGRFASVPNRGHVYEGGDVRLVSLPQGCSFSELVAVLAKTDAPRAKRCLFKSPSDPSTNPSSMDRSNASSGTWPLAMAVEAALERAAKRDERLSCCTIRYLLPSDLTVMVDVVDEDDVQMMFEELAEVTAAEGLTSAHKLRIFIQWELDARLTSVFDRCNTFDFFSQGYSAGLDNSSATPGGENTSQGSMKDTESAFDLAPGGVSMRGGSSRTAFSAVPRRASWDARLSEIRTDQLEVISAQDVILTEFLGTGTFGDMYKGTWLDNIVAVECLNPATLGLKYSSRVAWMKFLDDANNIGRLRHPNLVAVYGIVLPGSAAARSMPDLHQAQQAQHALQALQAHQAHSDPPTRPNSGGTHIPTTMGPRHTSWDFSSISKRCPSPTLSRIQRLPGHVAYPPALVMEFVSGGSLSGAIARGEEIVAGRLARVIYALDVARGMAYLHSKGVCHFDLKSSNVLLGWRNMRPAAKVAAYGLTARRAIMSSYTPGVTMNPSVFPWIAPEILRRPDQVSHKADVYSFSIIMYEMWALSRPYDSVSLSSLVHAAVSSTKVVRPHVPPPKGLPEPGPGWGDLVQRCWAEEPAERPEFEEIERELHEMARKVRRLRR